MMSFERSREFAQKLDREDPLGAFREQFAMPDHAKIYLNGNSLGLMPHSASDALQEVCKDWAKWGVTGHMVGEHPWYPYHEELTPLIAPIVGAENHEVVVMNTLTVNLHLMFVSFYRPTKERPAILVEANAFPSDRYAVKSQLRFHGFDPNKEMIEVGAEKSDEFPQTEDILDAIDRVGDRVALVWIGNVNYLGGQRFDMKAISEAAHKKGCAVGFAVAHGAGNFKMDLHDSGADFALWCHYKYLNGGPGTLGGAFVHERHKDFDGPRFEGWWGHDKATRMQMGPDFEPLVGVEAWQLSNPPIFQLAALRASLGVFNEAGPDRLFGKARQLTGYLDWLLRQQKSCRVLSPEEPDRKGSQLSVEFHGDGQELLDRFREKGVICDFRHPNVVRVAPVPLYNTFEEVFEFSEVLAEVGG